LTYYREGYSSHSPSSSAPLIIRFIVAEYLLRWSPPAVLVDLSDVTSSSVAGSTEDEVPSVEKEDALGADPEE
jgi:hypothetical protein